MFCSAELTKQLSKTKERETRLTKQLSMEQETRAARLMFRGGGWAVPGGQAAEEAALMEHTVPAKPSSSSTPDASPVPHQH